MKRISKRQKRLENGKKRIQQKAQKEKVQITMKDLELAKEITDALERNAKRWPQRVNHMLGLSLTDCSREERYVECEFTSQDWMKNPYDGVHGGIISSVADTCMGLGAVAFSQHYITTTDLSVSFLKAMMGDSYLVRVEYTQVGKRMIRCMAKITDKKTGALCVTAMGSFMALAPLEKDAWA